MSELTRRRFLQYGLGVGVALTVPTVLQSPAMAAVGGKLTKYMTRLPVPGNGIVVATPSGLNTYSFTQTPDQPPAASSSAADAAVGLRRRLAASAVRPARSGWRSWHRAAPPLDVSYTHDLPETYPAWLPVDTRLTPLGDEVRLMTHLHGGFVAADSDGNPAVTPNGFGPGETQTVIYTNQPPQMPASLLWFHDHGLGTTRLNVFAGLAAAYILRDQFDTGARNPTRSGSRRRLRDPARRPGPPVQPPTGRSYTRPATSTARPGSASTSAT